MIQTQRLRYMVTAVRCGSFRATAAAFGINPSSVSRQIRQLEHETGLTLFKRHAGGVAPTLAGQRLAEAARAFMEQVAGIGAGGRVPASRLDALVREGSDPITPADDTHAFLYNVQCA